MILWSSITAIKDFPAARFQAADTEATLDSFPRKLFHLGWLCLNKAQPAIFSDDIGQAQL